MMLAAAPAADHRAQQPPPADEDQQAAAATQRQALQRARALCLAVAAEREHCAAELDNAHERPSYFFDGGVARAYATVTPGNDGAAQEELLASGAAQSDGALLANLAAMGFVEDDARAALDASGGDFNQALDALFAGMG